MPVPYLRILAEQTGRSLEDCERYWNEAKAQAKKAGKENDWAYIVGIVQRRARVKRKIKWKKKGG